MRLTSALSYGIILVAWVLSLLGYIGKMNELEALGDIPLTTDVLVIAMEALGFQISKWAFTVFFIVLVWKNDV